MAEIAIQVTCPSCNEPHTVYVEPDIVIDAQDMPSCLECFITNKIFAPDEAKAWLYLQLKAFPYAIVP